MYVVKYMWYLATPATKILHIIEAKNNLYFTLMLREWVRITDSKDRIRDDGKTGERGMGGRACHSVIRAVSGNGIESAK